MVEDWRWIQRVCVSKGNLNRQPIPNCPTLEHNVTAAARDFCQVNPKFPSNQQNAGHDISSSRVSVERRVIAHVMDFVSGLQLG